MGRGGKVGVAHGGRDQEAGDGPGSDGLAVLRAPLHLRSAAASKNLSCHSQVSEAHRLCSDVPWTFPLSVMGRRDLGSGVQSPLRPVGNHWPIFLVRGALLSPRARCEWLRCNSHGDVPRSGGAVLHPLAPVSANWFALVPAARNGTEWDCRRRRCNGQWPARHLDGYRPGWAGRVPTSACCRTVH